MGIDDVSIFEAPFGDGQEATPSVALLDINDCVEALGFPAEFGQPGPYFATASAGGNLNIELEGQAFQPVGLFVGALQTALLDLGPIGQVDIMSPLLIGSGLSSGGLNPFFFTPASGEFTLNLTVPVEVVGLVATFQGIVFGSPSFNLTNAVQVTFVP